MTSVPDYFLLETAFTLLQWAIVSPLLALAYRGQSSRTIDSGSERERARAT
jgi:hypothetical protein